MQISKQNINPLIQKQLTQMFCQLLCDLNTPQEAEMVLRDFLSKTELIAITKRLGIMYWLYKKRSYQNIKQNLKVSSATIADAQQASKRLGSRLAMEKISAEEWAGQIEQKIKNVFKRK
jgi:uncharacterized protein YerC